MRTPFGTTTREEKDDLHPEYLTAREEVLSTFERVFFDLDGDQRSMFRAGFFGGWMEAGGKDPRLPPLSRSPQEEATNGLPCNCNCHPVDDYDEWSCVRDDCSGCACVELHKPSRKPQEKP